VSFYLSCFIFKLQPELQREVRSRQLATLIDAINLAKIYVAKFEDAQPKPKSQTQSKPYKSYTSTSILNTL